MNGKEKLTVGSICSGIEGIGLGLETTGGYEIRWHAEVEEDLAEWHERRWGVPNHGDITRADWREAERVDLITAGYPCQPFSQAGKRKGKDDERHIWPSVLRAIELVRPRWCVLENVSGHVTLGLPEVLADLRGAGYTTLTPLLLEAACFGAPHHRERVIILAYDHRERGRSEPAEQGEQAQSALDRRGKKMADAERAGTRVEAHNGGGQAPLRDVPGASEPTVLRQGNREGGTEGTLTGSVDVADSHDGERGFVREGQHESSGGGEEVVYTNVPGREEQRGREPETQEYSSVERTMRWPAQPRLGRNTDGIPYRLDAGSWPLPPGPRQWEWEPPRTTEEKMKNRTKRIKALGNAVVPHVGAFIGYLIKHLEDEAGW